MTYDEIKLILDNLSEEEKINVREYLEFVIAFGTNKEASDRLANFDHSSIVCPKCNSTHVSKNGHFRGKQRYVCVKCGASFNDFTNSFLYHNKLPIEKWIKFCHLFVDSKSLPVTARELDVTIATAFYMRHKLLDAISSSFDTTLLDIIEADETFLPVSYKGQKNLPRESRKRGKLTKKRGLSKEKVCIAVAIDLEKHFLIKPICLGRVQIKGLHNFFDNHILKGSILCTDRASAYMQIAKDLELGHHRYRNKNEFDEYHINHINSQHNNFKHWINNFRGVSTKYLDHYTTWFRLILILKNKKWIDSVREILKAAMKSHAYKTHKELCSHVPDFM